MRAVNLIPSDQQRGAGGAAGKSGGGAYVLLGSLALLVALVAVFVTSGKSVNDKKTHLADVTAQAAAAEAKATSLQSYTKFAAIREKRVATVTQLAAGRFDWAHALREVARVLPENAWLTSLTATTSPTVTVSGGATGQLRSAISSPAIVVQGCTTSQASVSKLLARLRLVDGVQRVSLEDATKGVESTSGGQATAGGASGDCRGGHAKFPQFNVDVFFDAPSTAVASSTTAGGAATTASATSAATSATPATTAAPASTSSVPASSTTGGTSK
jgi:Tfp pilus assembly protein PilN